MKMLSFDKQWSKLLSYEDIEHMTSEERKELQDMVVNRPMWHADHIDKGENTECIELQKSFGAGRMVIKVVPLGVFISTVNNNSPLALTFIDWHRMRRAVEEAHTLIRRCDICYERKCCVHAGKQGTEDWCTNWNWHFAPLEEGYPHA